MSDWQHHPQVIRAKELARAAGLDPNARIADDARDNGRSAYTRFMAAAFEEHFARTAVDNIFWDFYSADRWSVRTRDGDCLLSYGRCKSGRRWFWHVSGWVKGQSDPGSLSEHGFADSEEQALLDGTVAIKRLAAGRRVIASYLHEMAYGKLKEINTEKRKARPPSDATDSKRIEYLYGWHCRFQIVKKTAQRIYYLKEGERFDRHGEPTGERESIGRHFDDQVGFVDRRKLESTGEAGWLYASMEANLARYHRDDDKPPDLRQLKAAMADAHPDRGGSSAAFIEARKKYVEARRRLREQRAEP